MTKIARERNMDFIENANPLFMFGDTEVVLAAHLMSAIHAKELSGKVRSIASMRSDILAADTSRSRWTAATKFRAPHKPLLLLAVIDLIAQGVIKSNFIEFTPDLGNCSDGVRRHNFNTLDLYYLKV